MKYVMRTATSASLAQDAGKIGVFALRLCVEVSDTRMWHDCPMKTVADILRLRLRSLRLTSASVSQSPAQTGRHLLAMQGQDLLASLWAVGIRSGATLPQVEAGFNAGDLIRSWPMRGTLHVVAAEDIGWIQKLTTPSLLGPSLQRRWGQLGLTAAVAEQARTLALDILQGGTALGRDDFLVGMANRGLAVEAQWKYHLTWYLSQTGTLVFGPLVDGEHQLVLADEWIKHPRLLEGDDALAELAFRYVSSHGPVAVEDFSWWCGLGKRKVCSALALAGDRLVSDQDEDGRTLWFSPELLDTASPDEPESIRLLPAFDEHLLGYADRSAMVDRAYAPRLCPGNNGVFKPAIISNGMCVGIWRGLARAAIRKLPATAPVPVTVDFFEPTDVRHLDHQGLQQASDEYARYLGHPNAELRFA